MTSILVDNDVIQKLAKLDLLDECFGGAGRTDIRVLPTARFSLHVTKPRKGRDRYGVDAHQRITDFIEAAETVEEEPDLLARFTGIPNIEAGDAILIAATAGSIGDVLYTGDKRLCIALAQTESLSDIVEQLAGRLVCLEQLVLAAIDGHGFELVHSRVLAALDRGRVDGSLQLAMGGASVTEERAREALESFVRDLRAKSGPLLAGSA